MYKDVISYELAEQVSQEHLLAVARRIADEWMTKLPGFIRWEIHANATGGLTDIVYWQSEADAKNAEKEMANVPGAAEWYGCYKPGSISARHLHEIACISK